MITNLIAVLTVCIVTTTNDIPRWTPQTCSDMGSSWTMYIDEAADAYPLVDIDGTTNWVRFPGATGGGWGNDTQKVRIIQTKRIERIEYEWNGKQRAVVDETILYEKRTILNIRIEWDEGK